MAEEFKNVPEHDSSKITTEGEVKDRGLFDFLKKKEEKKPQETQIEPEFEHKTQVTEPTFVTNHEEEHKPSLLEKLHEKHEEEEQKENEKKPSLLHKLHRSDSSSSSSSEEEGEDGEKRKKKKKEKKKIGEGGEEKTEEEKKGIMEKIKEKLPGHGKKAEDDAPAVIKAPEAEVHTVEHTPEKKGFMEKIKEKLPGYHAKSGEEEEKKVKESD